MFRNKSASLLGSSELIKIGERRLESFKLNLNTFVEANKKTFQEKMKNDWLLQLMCQYSGPGNCLKVGDFIFYYDIMEMIRYGSLYLALLPISHWAYPDRNRVENFRNITDKYRFITVEEDTVNFSDGIFDVKGPLRLHRLYVDDESTPQNIPFIEIKDMTGYVEFGTQTIAKTAAYLSNRDAILRVPYAMENFPNLPPVLAIFYNTGTPDN